MRRSSGQNVWYSRYQRDIVGSVKTHWSREEDAMIDPSAMIDSSSVGGEDDLWPSLAKPTDGARDGAINGERSENTWKPTEPNNNEDAFEEGFLRNLAKYSELERNGVTPRRVSASDAMEEQAEPESSYGLLRRAISVGWAGDYEEYKPPKRYNKPPDRSRSSETKVFISGASGDKCRKCGHRLYEMEKILVDHFSYHKSCFKCTKCQRVLSLGSFVSIDGQPCCKSHSINDTISNRPSMGSPEAITTQENGIPTSSAVTTDVTLISIKDMKTIFDSNPTAQTQVKKQNAEVNRNVKTWNQSNAANDKQARIDLQRSAEKNLVNRDSSLAPHEWNNDGRSELVHQTRDNINGDEKVQLHHSAEDQRKKEASLTRMTNLNDHIPDDHIPDDHIRDEKETSMQIDNNMDFMDISDAFAKFRQLDNSQYEPVNPGERKPVRKITPPREEPRFYLDSLTEQNKIMEVEVEKSTTDAKPVVTIYANNEDTENGREMLEVTEVEDDRELKERKGDDRIASMEMPELKFTTNMLAKWKQMENHTAEKTKRSNSKTLSPRLSSPSAQKTKLFDLTYPVLNTSSEDEQMETYPSIPNTELNKQKPTEHGAVVYYHESRGSNTEPQSVYIPSLGFTKSGLAKFKELEKLTKNMTSAEKRLHKKEFKWGVKEVSPLHRPVLLVQQDSTDASDRLQVHRPSNEQMTGSIIVADEQLSIAAMKQTLDQFRQMEDPSKPPPTPQLTIQLQKTASTKQRKEFHDITQT